MVLKRLSGRTKTVSEVSCSVINSAIYYREIMKSEMKNPLLLDLIDELMMQTFVRTKTRVWLNSSIDMIQVQGFQYDPVYYQLLEPLSTGVQQRFSHTFGKYFILFWRHRGAPLVPDCHPPGGHSSLSTTLLWLSCRQVQYQARSHHEVKDEWEASLEIISRYNYSFASALPSSQH